ncbi:hypothetical protein BSKO_08658 [Bryopsis sp. KO-2023]|nr:hypothetical protein BSKO_08658 [Bryopsis sp. KO-2023]
MAAAASCRALPFLVHRGSLLGRTYVHRRSTAMSGVSKDLLDKLHDPALIHDSCLVGGERVGSPDGSNFEVFNPSTGESVASIASVGAETTNAAISAAVSVRTSWAETLASERSAFLKRWHQLIVESLDDLATIITAEAGKPLQDSKAELQAGLATIEWMAEECTRIGGEILNSPSPTKQMITLKQPVGVVGAITPWNFPANMIMRKVAPVLAAGCPVVLKPAELTPLSAIALAELADRAGLPKGVLSVVCGDFKAIGRALLDSADVRHITFTGSTGVGKYLAQEAGKTVKRVSMELGGNAPFIVFDDADLPLAAKHAVASALRNAGQACTRANRLLVQSGIYDEFVKAATEHVNQANVGNGFDSGVTLGPLISAQALEKVESHVADGLAKGGTCTAGGKRPDFEGASSGNFFEPTLLRDASIDMLCCQEETFGPLIPVVKFETEEEAIGLANATEYGLAAYFYTKDLGRAWRVAKKLESGIVAVNDIAFHSPAAPFGGMKQSGIGREQGREGLEEFLEVKHVCMGYGY